MYCICHTSQLRLHGSYWHAQCPVHGLYPAPDAMNLPQAGDPVAIATFSTEPEVLTGTVVQPPRNLWEEWTDPSNDTRCFLVQITDYDLQLLGDDRIALAQQGIDMIKAALNTD